MSDKPDAPDAPDGHDDSPEGSDHDHDHHNDDHNHHSHDHDRHTGHDHDHDSGNEEERERALREALGRATSGLKSDVQALLDVLVESQVYIPLSEDLEDTPEGEQIEMDGDLTFRPHMILGEEQAIYAVVYSEPSLVDAMQETLGWDTSGSDLKFICVPSDVALDLAQVTIDGQGVSGLVFNPGTEEELVLRRDEVASLARGVALPLVGYVSELGPDEEAHATVVEGAEPPPPALLDALERIKGSQPDLVGFSVVTTFDPERDREPHLTITLEVIGRRDLNRPALADAVMEEAGEHLPPPGYADIVFRDAPN